MACQQRRSAAERLDFALRDWQARFNTQVLAASGIFVKTQSICTVTYNDKGQKQRHIERWLAFALTETESIKLQGEPHVVGDVSDGKHCGTQGVDETQLCMHY